MASFADIAIRFSSNRKELSAELQGAQADLKRLGDDFKQAGKALTLGLTTPILAFGVKGALAWDKQERAIAQVEAGIKSSGNAARISSIEFQKLANDLSDITLFGDEEILSDATAQLLTFSNITDGVFQRTQKAALDLATRLDGDLKSASIQLGKALNDPVANLNALSRSGVTFSEEQKKVIKSFAKTGQLAQAQSLILEELEKQYGGSAEAAAKAGLGPFKQLGNAIDSLNKDFGKILAQALLPFVEKVKSVVSSLQNLDDGTKKTIAIIAGLAAALGPVLVTIGFMATNVIPGLITAFAALRTAFTALTATIAANPFGALAVVLGVAAAAFIAFGNSTEKAVKQQTILEQVSDAAAKSIAGEKAKLEELLFIARDEQVSKEQRLAAIQELNRISPKYLGNLSLEKINTDEARKAIDLYNESLLRTAKVKAAQERLTDIQSKIIDAEISGSKARKNILTDEAFQNKIKADAIRKGISVEQAQKELQDALNIGSGLRIKNLKDEATALLEIIKANDDFTSSLNASAEAVQGDFQRQQLSPLKIDANATNGIYAQNEALRAQIETWKEVQAQYPAGSKVYDDYARRIEEANITIANSMRGIEGEGVPTRIAENVNKITASWERLRESAVAIGESVGGAFEVFTGKFVNSLGLAEDGFQGFVKTLAAGVLKIIAQMLSASIAQAIAGGTSAGAATGPGAVVAIPTFIAELVGVVLGAFASIPKFAEGGLAYGPTLGMFGEYAGARNNPEVIAPLDKLRKLINPAGQAIIINGELTADGNKLRVLLNRTDARNSRLG